MALPGVAALSLLFAALPPPEARGSATEELVPGQVIVRFEDGTTAAERDGVLGRLGVEVVRDLRLARTQLLELEAGIAPLAASRTLALEPGVRYAHPNYIVAPAAVLNHQLEPSALPNDPRVAELWGLHNVGQTINGASPTPDSDIDAPGGWAVGTGSPNVTIAVVDSGVDDDHLDLEGDIWINPGETGTDGDGGDRRSNDIDDDGNGFEDDWRGWDWVGDSVYDASDADNDPDDESRHGTHVAGVAAARGNDGFGITGVTQRATIMPLRVLGDDGGTTADFADAFDYAGDMGADVINASLSGRSTIPPAAVKDAIEAHPNSLYVVSAGNEGIDNDGVPDPAYPCGFDSPNLICVAASDWHDGLASFSNYGSTSVDLAAPGDDMLSDAPFDGPHFREEFPSGVGAWTKSQGVSNTAVENTWGVTGDGRLSDSPGGRYQDPGVAGGPLDIRIESPALDFSTLGLRSCRLFYWVKRELEPGDELRVEQRLDGGGWEEAPIDRVATFAESWRKHSSNPISTRVTQFRFRLITDGAGGADGVEIDNVEFRCESNDSLEYLDGTSAATPHVTGAAALYKSVYPNAGPARIKEAILDGVETRPALEGKVVSGGRLSLARMLDRVAPSPPALQSPAPGAVLDTSMPTLGWEPSQDGGTGVWRYALVVDDQLNAFVPAGSTRSAPAAPLGEGTHRWFTVAIDLVGNTAPSASSRELTVRPRSTGVSRLEPKPRPRGYRLLKRTVRKRSTFRRR